MITNKFNNIIIRAIPKSNSTTFSSILKDLNDSGYISCDNIHKDHKTYYDNAPNTGYIILTRHPLDQLVAEYCDTLNICLSAKRIPGRIQSHFCVVNSNMIMKSPHHGIIELMDKGHLNITLDWLSNWIMNMNHKNCMLIRYEDLMKHPLEVNFSRIVNQVIRFADKSKKGTVEVDDDIIKRGIDMFNCYAIKKKKLKGSYPLGYSGGINIWEKYINKTIADRYAERIRCYVQSNNMAHVLNLAYPNLYQV